MMLLFLSKGEVIVCQVVMHH